MTEENFSFTACFVSKMVNLINLVAMELTIFVTLKSRENT